MFLASEHDEILLGMILILIICQHILSMVYQAYRFFINSLSIEQSGRDNNFNDHTSMLCSLVTYINVKHFSSNGLDKIQPNNQ